MALYYAYTGPILGATDTDETQVGDESLLQHMGESQMPPPGESQMPLDTPAEDLAAQALYPNQLQLIGKYIVLQKARYVHM